jgi:hypothetical protein
MESCQPIKRSKDKKKKKRKKKNTVFESFKLSALAGLNYSDRQNYFI